MYRLFRIYCLILAGLLIFAAGAGAQSIEVPPIADLTPETIFNSFVDPLYSAIIILAGYLSAYIPGLNKIKNTYIRVLAVALVSGLGFFLWKGSFTKIVISYFFSSGLYEIILKNIFKTPKSTEGTPPIPKQA